MMHDATDNAGNAMTTTTYAQLTADQTGAISLFLALGPEADLAAALDNRLRPRPTALAVGDIRHGWLCGRDDDDRVDEVMLVRPGDGQRLVMTHGGAAVRDAVAGYFAERGVARRETPPPDTPPFGDQLLLSLCRTDSQLAAALDALAAGRRPDFPTLAALCRERRLLLAGPANVGKSTLMNALAGYDRAFVHHEPGATRDVVDEVTDLAGYTVRVEDLPGYSPVLADLDRLAWSRAAPRLAGADAVLVVVDGSVPWGDGDEAAMATIAAALTGSPPVRVLLNKADLPLAKQAEPWRRHFPDAEAAPIAALDSAAARETVAGLLRAAWGPLTLPS